MFSSPSNTSLSLFSTPSSPRETHAMYDDLYASVRSTSSTRAHPYARTHVHNPPTRKSSLASISSSCSSYSASSANAFSLFGASYSPRDAHTTYDDLRSAFISSPRRTTAAKGGFRRIFGGM